MNVQLKGERRGLKKMCGERSTQEKAKKEN